MNKVIAGLYEIEQQIGAGGGGIVYLGRHIRLEKTVVLKADKRTLRAGKDILRREVDMLKGLSHTYIPQVYDFVEEDGVVYTVMDYIEGESFDKILARKQYLPQKDVIRWSCQLLDALNYLHGQGAYGILHGDIKPANIMLRPNGDICLIDFNIALALGEDGAVKVGFSRGYASPEHYGADYVDGGKESVVQVSFSKQETSESEKTEILRSESERTQILTDEDDKTVADTEATEILRVDSENASQKTAQKKKAVKLDVRSDIYSLGATLYHLFSGRRPAQKAEDVVPLTRKDCSEQISKILQKAMAPNPADRYQTASEMLDAFLSLRRNDKRVVRRRHTMAAVLSMGVVLFLAGGGLTFVGLKQMQSHQSALTMAAYSEEALRTGDKEKAVSLALSAIPMEKNLLEAPVTAAAQLALSNALGVYQLTDGFYATKQTDIASAPFELVTSPEGTRYAAVYAYETAVYDCGSGEVVVSLPTQESALSDCVFVDEETIIYAGEEGITAYDLRQKSVIWKGDVATNLALSGNRKIVAAIDRDDLEVKIYDVESGQKISECSFEGQHLPVASNDRFADPKNYIFELNEDGSFLGISFSNGGLWIADTSGKGNDLILYDASEAVSFDGAFCRNLFVFSAEYGNGTSELGFVDVENAEYLGGKDADQPFLLQSDENRCYIANGSLLEFIDAESLEEVELAYITDASITGFSVTDQHTFVAGDDGKYSFFDSGAHLMSTEESEAEIDFLALTDDYAFLANRNDPVIRELKLESHADKNLMSYDPRDVHDEARVSHDQKTMMLFSYDRFSIYDDSGKLVTACDLPDADQIYDQQFRREEDQSYLEVIWYDGMIRKYSAADGALIDETKKEAPDKTLLEEFWTDRYHIVSSLHEAPKVYDRESEEVVASLDSEDYLTYVTQTKEGIVTEYVTAEGKRYGYLLDEHLQKKAYLPNLCDVYNDSFVFDDGSGTLRACKIYTLEELVQMADTIGS